MGLPHVFALLFLAGSLANVVDWMIRRGKFQAPSWLWSAAFFAICLVSAATIMGWIEADVFRLTLMCLFLPMGAIGQVLSIMLRRRSVVMEGSASLDREQ